MKVQKMMNKIVVILEDEASVANALQMIAKKHGFTPICFMYVDDLIEDIDILKDVDLFITDYNLCDSTVIPLLEKIKEKDIHVHTILNSGNPNAMDDIKNSGLSDYIHETFNKTENFSKFFEKC